MLLNRPTRCSSRIEGDGIRFFIGRVDAYEACVVKATGHSYTWDVLDGP